MSGFLLALSALFFGSLVLSFVSEAIAGNQSFSLPLANIFLVVVIGAVLYWFFGWTSTAIVLGVYAVWAVVSGLIDRRS